MVLNEVTRGRCLVDHELQDLVDTRKIMLSDTYGLKMQPASFEPTLGRRLVSINTETGELFRPGKFSTIDEAIDAINKRQKTEHDITDGFDLRAGFTYLIQLQERFVLEGNERIKASPKSSIGRLFPRTRLLTDQNPCIDEVHAHYNPGQEVGAWLLVQPSSLNFRVHPNLALNQLRFFNGLDATLLDQEILAIHKENPLLYHEKTAESNTPVENPLICQGLQAHLDLSGKYSNGIIGLRTKRSQKVIDLQSIRVYDPLDFFEPLHANDEGELIIEPGCCYLLSGLEVVRIPTDTSAELRSNTHISLDGPVHLAGFFDPGFEARPVYEVRCDETTPIKLTHGMPLSRFEFYHNKEPTNPYGSEALASSFQSQTGIKLPKQFRKLRLEEVA
tara:strand:- start:90911 stop:92080 length:1170 start_codon:yes stop_codon:yes gene_type:complete